MEHLSRRITSLNGILASDLFWLRARHLRDLLRKANFSPNQPRVPAGQPYGGQWTLVGGSGGNDPGDSPEPPQFPEQEPPTRVVNAIAQAIAAYLLQHAPTSAAVDIFLDVNWLAHSVRQAFSLTWMVPNRLNSFRSMLKRQCLAITSMI